MSWKYKRLKHLWKRLHVDIISLIETQINHHLLDTTYNINENLFHSDLHFTIMSSNRNELIIKH